MSKREAEVEMPCHCVGNEIGIIFDISFNTETVQK